MSISTVTSEALQLKLRQLLPSQQGFGTDLTAQDTIVPIIDLTAAAEGSDVPEILQTAVSDSVTNVTASATQADLVTTTGFWRVTGITCRASSGTPTFELRLNDGTSDFVVFDLFTTGAGTTFVPQEYVIFVQSGSKIVLSASTNGIMKASAYQIADINGVFTNPLGFSPS